MYYYPNVPYRPKTSKTVIPTNRTKVGFNPELSQMPELESISERVGYLQEPLPYRSYVPKPYVPPTSYLEGSAIGDSNINAGFFDYHNNLNNKNLIVTDNIANMTEVYSAAEKASYKRGLEKGRAAKKRAVAKKPAARRRQPYRPRYNGYGASNPINIIQGRGAYTMNPEDSYGRQWGGYLGAKAGEFLGGAAQTMLTGLVSGLGDYQITKNVFMEGRLPQVVNNPAGGGIVIRFQEYLGDIISSDVAGEFKVDEYLINAANPKTFPFLSQVAQNFEQYEFEGLLFAYKSQSGDAMDSVNTALGTVMLSTQYDVNDDSFTNKLEMLNYEYSSSCKPSANVVHMIECAPSQTTINLLYTLDQEDVPNNSDPRFYHLGRFAIASQGCQGTSVTLGQLHVTYQVRLLKPKLYESIGQGIPYASNYRSSGTLYTNSTPFCAVARTTDDPLAVVFDVNGVDFSITGCNPAAVVTLLCEIIWDGDETACNTGALTLTNCELLNGGISVPSASDADRLMLRLYIKTLGTGVPSVNYSTLPTLPANGTTFNFIMTQVDDDIRS